VAVQKLIKVVKNGQKTAISILLTLDNFMTRKLNHSIFHMIIKVFRTKLCFISFIHWALVKMTKGQIHGKFQAFVSGKKDEKKII
jgi:hypothetical protein